ncbi:putative holin-like toxin [Paenibacillus sp. FSL R7-0179]
MTTYEALQLMIDFGGYTITAVMLIVSIQALKQTKK